MTRTPGLRGLLPAQKTNLPELHTLACAAVEVPESYDATSGWKNWLSFGNAPSTGLPGDKLTINGGKEVGDCFFAALYHGLMTKALVQDTAGAWQIKAEGFAVPTANQVVGLYLGYQNGLAPGKSATSGPDNGTEPVAGFQWFQKAGIIKRWGPVDVSKLNAGTYSHKGVLLACALDEDAEEEFAEGKPWLNRSQAVDPIEGGHAIYRPKYRPKWATELTWGADEDAADAWEKAHVQNAYWFQAPWEPDAAGYDFGPLDAALSVL